jgi:hypothetical protein
MSAKYTFGGISKRLGVFKVRVGQGDLITRIKMMIKEEHEEIDLVEFGEKLTKAEVCKELMKIARFAPYRDIINETYDKKMGLPVATTSVAKPTKKAVKPAPLPVVKAPKQLKVAVKKYSKEESDDDLLIEELKNLIA